MEYNGAELKLDSLVCVSDGGSVEGCRGLPDGNKKVIVGMGEASLELNKHRLLEEDLYEVLSLVVNVELRCLRWYLSVVV